MMAVIVRMPAAVIAAAVMRVMAVIAVVMKSLGAMWTGWSAMRAVIIQTVE